MSSVFAHPGEDVVQEDYHLFMEQVHHPFVPHVYVNGQRWCNNAYTILCEVADK